VIVATRAAAIVVFGTLCSCVARDGPPGVGEHLWSDPMTWNASVPRGVPRAGDDVTIPRGESIVLDVTPPHLRSLRVAGVLRFDDRDLTVRAGDIAVTGQMWVGSDARPFEHHAEIVLESTPDGRGTISISSGGRLELHGAPRVSWTTLAATALPGRTAIDLVAPVDWQPGDRIALAPSGFAATEAEEARVTFVRDEHVGLSAPLRYRHWGTVTDGIDERAEVGLLSHDIVVRGEPGAAARGFGGQVIVLRGGTLRASNAEFYNLGQRGKLGRYPIHFHETGDGSASLVSDSSIDHSFNRCLTIHGTSGVLVRGNVAFDTVGHCYFLEDGIERGNVFERDLGMLTRAPDAAQAILATDLRPATFWIANPDNVVRDDRAAGSEGTGFWYSLGATPGGLAARSLDVHPREIALGEFSGDVAHSNEHDGLFVDNLRNPPGVSEAPNYEPPVTADFTRFTSYKNRRHGVWLRGRNLALEEPHLGDNAIGATFAAADTGLHDGTVVGETENATGPPKPDDASFPLRGFEFYDGPVSVERTHFANFRPDARREASALSALEFSPFFMDPGQFVRSLTFSNAQPVYFRHFAIGNLAGVAADGYRSVVFRDLDGSVSGLADSTIVYDTPLLARGCTRVAPWNAAVCRQRFGSLFVFDTGRTVAGIGPIRVATEDEGAARVSTVLAGNPDGGGVRENFQTNIARGERYVLSFTGHVPRRIRLAIHGMNEGDAVAIALPQWGACVPAGAVDLVAHGPLGLAFSVVDLTCPAAESMPARPKNLPAPT